MAVASRACVVATVAMLTWLLPSSAVAVEVTIGQPPNANTIFVTASPGETNRLTVTRDASDYTVVEAGPATMTPGAGCRAGPGANSATCPDAGISQVFITVGDADDGVTMATPTNSVIVGGSGNDTVDGGGAQDVVRGQDGDDTLRGGAGDDLLYGDETSELDPASGADRVEGGDGNDTLNGGRGPDTLLGDAGADVLKGGAEADTVSGGDGPDRVSGEGGDDRMEGGPGDDVVGVPGTTAVGATLEPAEPGNDTLLGGPGNDALDPGAGGDGDHDTLLGEDGDDSVSFGLRSVPIATTKDGVANDGQAGEGDNIGGDVERLTGGPANDSVGGGPGADVLDGGPGDDVVNGFAGNDELHGDGGLSAGTDTVAGGAGDDRIQGEGGADTLLGDAGSDAVDGGTGTDTLSGGPGKDDLVGGPDVDAVAYTVEQDVTVRLDAGAGSTATPGDTDRVVQIEDVDGGDKRDTLIGSTGGNVLDGAVGQDYVDGRRGVDRLDGGPSADVVAARDGARDEPVSCGPGVDLAIVDPTDRVERRGANRCEQVDDGQDTRPTQGQVYVQPQRCAAAERAELGPTAMTRPVPLRYSILLPSGYGARRAPWLRTTGCTMRMTAPVDPGRRASAELSGGPFRVGQTSRRRVTTELTFVGPTCGAGTRSAAAAAGQERVRVNTGRRRGRWKVKGKYSTGASVGTDWTTVEGCSRTTTIVRRGRVRVFDREKGRTVTVRAGETYVARESGRSSGHPSRSARAGAPLQPLIRTTTRRPCGPARGRSCR